MQKINFTIPGPPRTSKNSQKIARGRGGGRYITAGDAYKAYRAESVLRLNVARVLKDEKYGGAFPIQTKVNIRCLYYMDIDYENTKDRIDLPNLLNGTDDILKDAKIVEDDNCRIVAGHDGSRVLYDKDHPRVDITIEYMEDKQ